jgi:hypothetical protein
MFRFFEVLPGALAWMTLLGLIFLSWRLPTAVAFFIILFDLYWLLKTIYLFFHLRYSFLEMRKNLKINWLKKIQEEKIADWEKIYHLVIFPMYREPYELIRQSFLSLLKTNYPKEKIFAVLAVEERGGQKDLEVALRIQKEFGESFGAFLYTVHPAQIPGELAGKGSNETWAARQVKEKIIDPRGIPYSQVLVSVFDSDTQVGPDYFAILVYKFLTFPNGRHSSFQPIPLYINNFYKTNAFARLIAFSTTFWQLMQQSRKEQLVTFSSHSLPFEALVEVGFWQTNIVSEDSRIFFQCFNYFSGDWQTVPLFYPVYMDAVSGKNFWEAVRNLYRQQRRWAWGVENIPYALTDFIRNKMIPLKKKLSWVYILFEGFYSWAVSSLIIFLFGWLPLMLGGSEFRATVISYNLPRLTGFLMRLSTTGIIISAVLSIVLSAPRLRDFKKYYYVLYCLQWFLLPFVFIIFSSLPALEAQTRLMLGGRLRLGFWKTPKANRS